MSNPPQEFLCPITCSIMRDPVVCSDGESYESWAIQKWLKQKATSPAAGRAMKKVLFPNRNLKKLIEEWKEANNYVDEPEPVVVPEAKKKRKRAARRTRRNENNECVPCLVVFFTIVFIWLIILVFSLIVNTFFK